MRAAQSLGCTGDDGTLSSEVQASPGSQGSPNPPPPNIRGERLLRGFRQTSVPLYQAWTKLALGLTGWMLGKTSIFENMVHPRTMSLL